MIKFDSSFIGRSVTYDKLSEKLYNLPAKNMSVVETRETSGVAKGRVIDAKCQICKNIADRGDINLNHIWYHIRPLLVI